MQIFNFLPSKERWVYIYEILVYNRPGKSIPSNCHVAQISINRRLSCILDYMQYYSAKNPIYAIYECMNDPA